MLRLVLLSGFVATLLAGAPAPVAVFTVTSSADSGPGSLRQALLDANAAGGTISFSIGGGGAHTIAPLSPLPVLQGLGTLIDGTTQPGYAGTPLITVDGSSAGDTDGFIVAQDDCGIRGLILRNFQRSAVHTTALVHSGGRSGDNLSVSSNHLLQNGGCGFEGESGHAITIASNVISGNTLHGISLNGSRIASSSITSNVIGADPSGTTAIPNGGSGIRIEGSRGHVVGSPGAGNLISGNALHGIHLLNVGTTPSDFVRVEANRIGTDATGTSGLPNGQAGVCLEDTRNDTIGGEQAGSGNTIRFNGGPGVRIAAPTMSPANVTANVIQGNTIRNNVGAGVQVVSGVGNPIWGNSIGPNGGLGIDLGPPGVTVNDAGDGDVGPNNLQNYPSMSGMLSYWNGVSEFAVSFVTVGLYRVEFFRSTAADPSSYGEGEVFLGAVMVSIEPTGLGVTCVLPVAVPAGALVTATATDAFLNTSEFCPFVVADPPVAPSIIDIDAPTVANRTYTTASPFVVEGPIDVGGGVTSVAWSQGMAGGPATISSGRFSAAVPGLTPGRNVVSVAASGAAGLLGQDMIEVYYDPTPPTIGITLPTSAPSITVSTPSVSVWGSASDTVAVKSVTWTNGAESGQAAGSAGWNAGIPLAPGSNLITVTATDFAGNTASDTLTVIRDAVPPMLTVSAPAPGATASSASVAVAGTASDDVALSHVSWTNAALVSGGTATGSATWTADIPLAPGPNLLTMEAEDAAGNTTTSTLTVTYEPPPLSSGGGGGGCGLLGLEVLALLLLCRALLHHAGVTTTL